MTRLYLTLGRFQGPKSEVTLEGPVTIVDLARSAREYWEQNPSSAQMADQVLIWNGENETPQKLIAVWSPTSNPVLKCV